MSRSPRIQYIPLAGYLRFYRSLLFYTRAREPYASQMLYSLYIGNLDSLTSAGSPARIISSELGPDEFRELLVETPAHPYRTSVQFFRSCQYLLRNICADHIQNHSRRSVSYLEEYMEKLCAEFMAEYGMEITDKRTCYALCENRLLPVNEPCEYLIRKNPAANPGCAEIHLEIH